MTCAALSAIAGAVTITLGLAPDGDTLVLAPHETAEAQICYYNHAAQVSVSGTHTITMGGLTVEVEIVVGGDAETLAIIPPPGRMVFPADRQVIDVLDGEHSTALIVMGMM